MSEYSIFMFDAVLTIFTDVLLLILLEQLFVYSFGITWDDGFSDDIVINVK